MKKDLLNFYHCWKLRDWIDEKKLNWEGLCKNPNAMYLIEANYYRIIWGSLFTNPSALYIYAKAFFSNKQTNGNWYHILQNPFIIYFLQRNFDKINFCEFNWDILLTGTPFHILARNSTCTDILEKYLDKKIWLTKIKIPKYADSDDDFYFNKNFWINLSENPSAIHLLEKNKDKINWWSLSSNPSAIHLLEKNPDKIDWGMLSKNPSAVHILEKNQDKISWNSLSANVSAIHLLEKNKDKISWWSLSSNPLAIHLLEQNQDKIDWTHLSYNPSAISLLEQNQDKIDWKNFSINPAIFELDYDFFKKRMNLIREELMVKTWHPERFEEWCL